MDSRLKLVILAFALACAARAQGGGVIVASVSRTVTLTPDVADFTVVVTTPLNTPQPDISRILHALGAENARIIGAGAGPVGTSGEMSSEMIYELVFSVAPGALKAMTAKLDGLRRNPPAPIATLDFSSSPGSTQAAVDAARNTALPQLLADARSKAQGIAAAEGVTLGGILNISDQPGGAYGLRAAFLWVPVSIVNSVTDSGASQFTFYATVTFAVAGQ